MNLNNRILRLLSNQKNNLSKIPNQKNVLLIISIFFYLLAWINKPTRETEMLSFKENMILEKTPQYGRDYGKHHGPWIKLKFANDKSTYIIENQIYETFSHNQFKSDINIYDTLKIGTIYSEVYSLKKGDFEYCDLQGANKKRSVVFSFMKIIPLVSIILLLILKGLESTKINDKWDLIWFLGMILAISLWILM